MCGCCIDPFPHEPDPMYYYKETGVIVQSSQEIVGAFPHGRVLMFDLHDPRKNPWHVACEFPQILTLDALFPLYAILCATSVVHRLSLLSDHPHLFDLVAASLQPEVRHCPLLVYFSSNS